MKVEVDVYNNIIKYIDNESDKERSKSRSKSNEKSNENTEDKKYKVIYDKNKYACCDRCLKSSGHGDCPCIIPANKRHADISKDGCAACGCYGCHPVDIRKRSNYDHSRSRSHSPHHHYYHHSHHHRSRSSHRHYNRHHSSPSSSYSRSRSRSHSEHRHKSNHRSELKDEDLTV